MASITVQLPFNYTTEDLVHFLYRRRLSHLKFHDEMYLKVGDALKAEKGIIARVVDRFVNYENLTVDYTIANNKMCLEDMYLHFEGIIVESIPTLVRVDGELIPEDYEHWIGE